MSENSILTGHVAIWLDCLLCDFLPFSKKWNASHIKHMKAPTVTCRSEIENMSHSLTQNGLYFTATEIPFSQDSSAIFLNNSVQHLANYPSKLCIYSINWYSTVILQVASFEFWWYPWPICRWQPGVFAWKLVESQTFSILFAVLDGNIKRRSSLSNFYITYRKFMKFYISIVPISHCPRSKLQFKACHCNSLPGFLCIWTH